MIVTRLLLALFLIPSIVFSSESEQEWIRTTIDQYPEILWLADSNVQITQEGQGASKGTPSETLFGQSFAEFDRTIMTLKCLNQILDGDEEAYEAFTSDQPNDAKLSFESFQKLHHQAKEIQHSKWGDLSDGQLKIALETALILGDMGKSKKARDRFPEITAPDHDDFHGEAMIILSKNPELSPSFSRLPEPAKSLLVKTAHLAHYGHLTHLEGDHSIVASLKKTKIASDDPIALSFDLLIHTCDVAGALGHVNPNSSLVYTEPTHRAMQAMNGAVRLLAKQSAWRAYDSYLRTRAQWLGLNANDPIDRVLTGIGAMLRLFTIEEGCALKQAMQSLDSQTRQEIAKQLNVEPSMIVRKTPTYMPAVLINLSNNPSLGSTKEQRLEQAVRIGLPFLNRALKEHHVLLEKGQMDPNIPLNFNPAAGVAKSHPHALFNAFYIDKQGLVHPSLFSNECFQAEIFPITPEIRNRMRYSWRDDNPVPLNELRYVQLTHWDFDQRLCMGELIVHEQVAEEIADLFEELFLIRYPIEKMRLIDEYQADDEKSCADNNSSAFCSRPQTNQLGGWSVHSFGTAIDINPRLNPYHNRDLIVPENGTPYIDRSLHLPGMIDEEDACFLAFQKRGWNWGGHWTSLKDYQHFEKIVPSEAH